MATEPDNPPRSQRFCLAPGADPLRRDRTARANYRALPEQTPQQPSSSQRSVEAAPPLVACLVQMRRAKRAMHPFDLPLRFRHATSPLPAPATRALPTLPSSPSFPARLAISSLVVLIAGAVSAAFETGCGSSMPMPTAVKNDPAGYVEVPYPPPAARIEFVPEKPDEPGKNLEWVDGEWRWRGKRWRWTAGGWFDLPPGTKLAHWAVVVRADGQMLFEPSVWQDASGKPLAQQPAPIKKSLSNVSELDEPETVRQEPAVHGPDMPANPAAVAGAHSNNATQGTAGEPSSAQRVSPP